MSVKAEKNGTVGWFPEGVWASGVPERNGWVRIGKSRTENVIPKEVIDFSEKQAETVKKKDVRDAVRKITAEPEPEVTPKVVTKVEPKVEPKVVPKVEPKPVAKKGKKPRKTKKNG